MAIHARFESPKKEIVLWLTSPMSSLGSEATGGAGLQVDLKTFQALDVYGVATTTCIVSFDPKNNWGHRFVPIAPDVIADQIEAATAAHDLDVVKIGMLGTPATIEVVAEGLRRQSWRHVVLDPVLICKGQEPGAALDTDTALRDSILPARHRRHNPTCSRHAPSPEWTASKASTTSSRPHVVSMISDPSTCSQRAVSNSPVATPSTCCSTDRRDCSLRPQGRRRARLGLPVARWPPQ